MKMRGRRFPCCPCCDEPITRHTEKQEWQRELDCEAKGDAAFEEEYVGCVVSWQVSDESFCRTYGEYALARACLYEDLPAGAITSADR